MPGFYGRYEVTLDGKGRFLLPARLKKHMIGAQEEAVLILNWGDDGCVNLYTEADWNAEVDKLRRVDEDESEEKRRFKRHYLGGAFPVELDSAGRISIPKYLLQHGALVKDMILNGNDNRVEIWDLERFNKFFDGFSHSDFTAMKAGMLGKKQEG
ncbi:MAG TPA: hypothetical protein PKD90_02440 [Phnomibacter sp.]|nr:hypothetical protein [Phnomibacter sp.]